MPRKPRKKLQATPAPPPIAPDATPGSGAIRETGVGRISARAVEG